MSKADDFFDGFEPKTLKVDPIGPTGELKSEIARLTQSLAEAQSTIARLKEEKTILDKMVASDDFERMERDFKIMQVKALQGYVYDRDKIIARLQSENAALHSRIAELESTIQFKTDAETSPDHVEWTSARTVGHLVEQLRTLPPETGITAVTWVNHQGKRLARGFGVSMSWERVVEGGWLDYKREDVPRSVVIWAHAKEEVELRDK